jgi:hypothetical protein
VPRFDARLIRDFPSLTVQDSHEPVAGLAKRHIVCLPQWLEVFSRLPGNGFKRGDLLAIVS